MKQYKYILGLLVLVALSVGTYFGTKDSNPVALGSIPAGTDYLSTFSAPNIALPGLGLLKKGSGTFGSVIITGAAAGTFELYDASTTNKNLRTPVNGSTATTSLRKLASFPTNAAVGTYTFDTNFNLGLVEEFTSTQGTTTVSWR